MKKILLATTMIAMASTAMADITFSGMGRFGVNYVNKAPAGAQKTALAGRVRFNISGSTTTDSGASFGGKLRLQSDIGKGTQNYSGAVLSMDAVGLHVEVGNVNTAFDSASLLWNSEVGFADGSFGDPTDAVYAYSSGPTGVGYAGIYASYSVGGFNVQASAVDDNQAITGNPIETALAIAYSAGALSFSAAGYHNGAGVSGSNGMFVGAAYKLSDVANVGLNYIDEDASAVGKITTLYGNYTMGAITVKGYAASASAAGTDTALGLGADYALGGGARVSGAIEKGYAGQTIADVGVRFDF